METLNILKTLKSFLQLNLLSLLSEYPPLSSENPLIQMSVDFLL